MHDEQKVCLYGEFAKPFMKSRVGDKVKMEVEAIVTSASLEHDYGAEVAQPSNGKKKKEPPKRPRVEFVISKVNGRGGRSVAELTGDEMEKEIHYAKEPK